MRFGLSDEQQSLDRSIRRFLDRQSEAGRIAPAAGHTAFDEPTWRGLCELGVPALCVPEQHGGLGGGCLDAVVVAEALGAGAVSVPSLGALGLASFVITESASDKAGVWLPQIAAGDMRVAFFSREMTAGGPTGFALKGGCLTGSLRMVPEVASATHLMLLLDDGRYVLADLTSERVSHSPLPSLDRTRPVSELRFEDVAAEPLGGSVDAVLRGRIVDRARVLLSAEVVGAASTMLRRAVEYSLTRVQFSRPIGSFQAIKHLCAEMATMLAPARPLVLYAAYAADRGLPDAHLAACHAKAHVAEVGRAVADMATQVHGAIGFTDELGLHLLFKRIAASRQIFGSPEACREDAAAAQGWINDEEPRQRWHAAE